MAADLPQLGYGREHLYAAAAERARAALVLAQQLLYMAAQAQERRAVHVQLLGRGLGDYGLLHLVGQLGQHVALEPAQQEGP